MITGGIVLGLIVAIATSSVLTSLLFGVQPADPVTLLGMAALFMFVGVSRCCCRCAAHYVSIY